MGPQLRADLPDGAIPGDDRFLPARSVWERYGVTSMSLYRWLDDEEMGFPKPLYIGRFRFWRLADLIEWENSRPRTGTPYGASALARANSAAA
jgi:predicted DNA-binding transcriptional regulator AlpA